MESFDNELGKVPFTQRRTRDFHDCNRCASSEKEMLIVDIYTSERRDFRVCKEHLVEFLIKKDCFPGNKSGTVAFRLDLLNLIVSLQSRCYLALDGFVKSLRGRKIGINFNCRPTTSTERFYLRPPFHCYSRI